MKQQRQRRTSLTSGAASTAAEAAAATKAGTDTRPRSSINTPTGGGTNGQGRATRTRTIQVGTRVILSDARKRGVVRFIGTTQFASGKWVGVELDPPDIGKNDGSVQGFRYFECQPHRGVFVKKSTLTVERKSRNSTTTNNNNNNKQAERMPDKHEKKTQPAVTAEYAGTASITTVAAATAPHTDAATAADTDNTTARAATPRSTTTLPPRQTALPPPSKQTSPTIPPKSMDALTSAAAAATPARTSLADLDGVLSTTIAPVLSSSSSFSRASQKVEAASLTPTATSAVSGPKRTWQPTDSPAPEAITKSEHHVAAAGTTGVASAAATKPLPAADHSTNHNPIILSPLSQEKTTGAVIEPTQDALKPPAAAATDGSRLAIKKLQQELAAAMDRCAALEEQIDAMSQLQDLVEVLTVDKEIVEETLVDVRVELAETKEDLQRVRLELDGERKRQRSHREALLQSLPVERGDVARIVQQNQDLTEALRKLRDITVVQSKQVEESQRKYIDKEKELEIERVAHSKIRDQLDVAQAAIEDLKQAVDESSTYETMAEQLTQDNLQLSEAKSALESRVKELVRLQEASDDIEHGHIELEQQLHGDIETKDGRIYDLERKLERMEVEAKDLRGTVSKFRQYVKSVEDKVTVSRVAESDVAGLVDALQARLRSEALLSEKLKSRVTALCLAAVQSCAASVVADGASAHANFLKAHIPAPPVVVVAGSDGDQLTDSGPAYRAMDTGHLEFAIATRRLQSAARGILGIVMKEKRANPRDRDVSWARMCIGELLIKYDLVVDDIDRFLCQSTEEEQYKEFISRGVSQLAAIENVLMDTCHFVVRDMSATDEASAIMTFSERDGGGGGELEDCITRLRTGLETLAGYARVCVGKDAYPSIDHVHLAARHVNSVSCIVWQMRSAVYRLNVASLHTVVVLARLQGDNAEGNESVGEATLRVRGWKGLIESAITATSVLVDACHNRSQEDHARGGADVWGGASGNGFAIHDGAFAVNDVQTFAENMRKVMTEAQSCEKYLRSVVMLESEGASGTVHSPRSEERGPEASDAVAPSRNPGSLRVASALLEMSGGGSYLEEIVSRLLDVCASLKQVVLKGSSAGERKDAQDTPTAPTSRDVRPPSHITDAQGKRKKGIKPVAVWKKRAAEFCAVFEGVGVKNATLFSAKAKLDARMKELMEAKRRAHEARSAADILQTKVQHLSKKLSEHDALRDTVERLENASQVQTAELERVRSELKKAATVQQQQEGVTVSSMPGVPSDPASDNCKSAVSSRYDDIDAKSSSLDAAEHSSLHSVAQILCQQLTQSRAQVSRETLWADLPALSVPSSSPWLPLHERKRASGRTAYYKVRALSRAINKYHASTRLVDVSSSSTGAHAAAEVDKSMACVSSSSSALQQLVAQKRRAVELELEAQRVFDDLKEAQLNLPSGQQLTGKRAAPRLIGRVVAAGELKNGGAAECKRVALHVSGDDVARLSMAFVDTWR